MTVGVVCEKCNNGWMSALESRTKPYLDSAQYQEVERLREGAARLNMVAVEGIARVAFQVGSPCPLSVNAKPNRTKSHRAMRAITAVCMRGGWTQLASLRSCEVNTRRARANGGIRVNHPSQTLGQLRGLDGCDSVRHRCSSVRAVRARWVRVTRIRPDHPDSPGEGAHPRRL